jgi:AcrR family transcriptional regulator
MYRLSEPVNPRRRYDSSRRVAQARENRAAIVAAAQRLFLEQGYAATTMGSVAASAGLSVETIYKAFDNKAGLLKAVFDVAVVGDDEPIPMLQREAVQRNMAEPDPRKKLEMYAQFYVERAARSVPVQLLTRQAAASDPAVAEVWKQMMAERLVGMTAFANDLGRGGHLRPGVTVDDARDVLWTYNSAELWELLVIHRGWALPRFGRFISEALIAALL